MQRRTFLIQSLAAGLSAQTTTALSDRIGISSWSFHNFFSTTLDEKLPKLTKSWDLRNFPEMIADRYHVHQLEMVAPHFESTKLAYVREVKSRLARAHSHLGDGARPSGGFAARAGVAQGAGLRVQPFDQPARRP